MGIWLFGTLAFVGLLGMTWLFPLLARAFSSKPNPATASSAKPGPLRIAILIPAYNEEAKLPRTLRSIQVACAGVDPKVLLTQIHVASDGSKDRTSEVARGFAGVKVVDYPNRGKWKTIRAIATEVAAALPRPDWIAFADSGIEWPADILARAIPYFQVNEVVAVAPTYRAPRSGAIEAVVWSIERHFKALETSCGGPVSIHGASIFYRTDSVLRVFEELGEGTWLNDDVVIPLTLRAQEPLARIVYAPELAVYDSLHEERASGSTAGPPSAYRRRRRLVMGNLQWISELLPAVARRNPVAATLALRRIFRLLWAYWGASLAVMGALWLSDASMLGLMLFLTLNALALLAAIRLPALGGLVASATASLLAPVYLMTRPGGKSGLGQAAWK